MKDTIEEIKRKIDIVEFISSSVQLKRAGRNFKGNCPFHHEKTPSFVVSPDRQIWRCFGACQDGGDIIAYVMKLENVTFYEALKELAHQAGVVIKNLDFEDKAWSEKEKLISVNNLAAKMYHYILLEHASGKLARKYLEKRGIGKKLMETFQLGYAPQSWDSLTTYLKKKGHQESDIIKAGLALSGKNGKPYDRFRGRLMFPIINNRNVILGFSGRLLHDQEKQAKYVNTPETPLYHKRETLYGMNVAKDAIISEKSAILTEGEFDMISCYKNGIKNVVAIKGSAVTKDQLTLLKRFTQHIVLALDADFSGTETTKRAIQDAEELDFRVDIIKFENVKDPDEALKNDPVSFKKLLQKPIPIYNFIINASVDKHNIADPYEKGEILKEVFPFIENISNPIVFAYYIKNLAQQLVVDEEDVKRALFDFRKKRNVRTDYKQKFSPTSEQIPRPDLLQKYVLAVILQSEKPRTKLIKALKILNADDFFTPSYQDIMKQLEKKTSDIFDVKNFANNLSDPLKEVLDDIFLFDISSDVFTDVNFTKMLYELKRYALKKKIHTLMQKDSEDANITDLTKEVAEVEKHLSDM